MKVAITIQFEESDFEGDAAGDFLDITWDEDKPTNGKNVVQLSRENASRSMTLVVSTVGNVTVQRYTTLPSGQMVKK